MKNKKFKGDIFFARDAEILNEATINVKDAFVIEQDGEFYLMMEVKPSDIMSIYNRYKNFYNMLIEKGFINTYYQAYSVSTFLNLYCIKKHEENIYHSIDLHGINKGLFLDIKTGFTEL